MAIPTLSELFSKLTRDQIVASALKIAGQVGLPVTAWQSGSVGREIVEILCELMSQYLSGASTTAAAAGLLDYAQDLWLDLTGNQIWAVDRPAASFGQCAMVLTNSGAIDYPFGVGDLRFYRSDNPGVTYENVDTNGAGGTSPALIPAHGTVTVTIIAETAGTVANAVAGEIDELVTPLNNVTASNTTPLVGSDAMTNPAYVALCRSSNAALSPNGPRDAYDYFARTATRPDGSNVGVTRTFDFQTINSPGVVILYLASDAGPVAPSDVAIVQEYILQNVVPTSISFSAASAVEHDLRYGATVFIKRGSSVDPTALRQAILASLLAFFRQLPIGGVPLAQDAPGQVFDESVSNAIYDSSDQIVLVTLTLGAGDVTLAQNEVAVLTSVLSDFYIQST